MEQYHVTGMSCAACSARVEKAVLAVEGVTACSVNLLTNSMTVEGTAKDTAVISAVQKAGYQADKKGADHSTNALNDLSDTETPLLFRRFLSSLIFLFLLMYLSMGHVMWGFPLPSVLSNSPLIIGALQMLLCVIIMGLNHKFFTSGVKGLIHRSPNMDTLVSLGSFASFIYSVYILITAPKGFLHGLYFESAAMILVLITLGKTLEARSKGKTTNALKSLMNLAPKTATVLRDGNEVVIPVEEIKKGDLFVVRPGESIPADGIVLQGHSAVDESALTGESIPNEKSPGNTVSSATLNRSGYLQCEATRVGEDTTLSQIIKMVSDAVATKAPIAKIADRISGIFVPIVISVAVVVFIIWLLIGQTTGFALTRATAILVISCPCALGLATPVAIMVGTGKGAKNAILFKTATSLEVTGKTQIIALDKTGTITKGKPEVTDIIGDEGFIQIAYSLEKKSEHPLAQAIVNFGEKEKLPLLETTDFSIFPGGGLIAKINKEIVCGGNADFISHYVTIPQEMLEKATKLAEEGKTVVFFAKGKSLLGIIAMADQIKDDSEKAIRELKNMGIRVVMLTGDNQATAQAIGNQSGVSEIIAQVKPDQKDAVIRKLQQSGKVAMVGDGINDAPALSRAHIGIAIGAGTDIAMDAADVVLMNSKLSDVPAAIRLSRATLRTIHQNLFWAFIYNIVSIPIAAGAFIWAGLSLNPMIGAAAMSLSSFCVVTNALRLNLCNIHSTKQDKKHPFNSRKEVIPMEKTIKIQGMMCPHCEARVKKLLEETDGILSAAVSHENDTAVITMADPVSDEVLTKLITDNGYTVIEII